MVSSDPDNARCEPAPVILASATAAPLAGYLNRGRHCGRGARVGNPMSCQDCRRLEAALARARAENDRLRKENDRLRKVIQAQRKMFAYIVACADRMIQDREKKLHAGNLPRGKFAFYHAEFQTAQIFRQLAAHGASYG